MSSLHAAVRAQSQTRSTISEVMGEINAYIFENSPPNKFLTLFYGELDPETGILRYSNGGHNTPLLLRRPGEIVYLDQGGLPIGLDPMECLPEDGQLLVAADKAGLQAQAGALPARTGLDPKRAPRRDGLGDAVFF